MSDAPVLPTPANRAIRLGDDGRPWTEGYRCDDCGAATGVHILEKA